MTDTTRLEAIEIKLAHLERSLQELGQVVMRQQTEIAALAARNRLLSDQMEALESGGAENAGQYEKPPHY
jgi:SlyX protein